MLPDRSRPLASAAAPLLAGRVASWIAARRAEHRPEAERLTADEIERLAGYYDRTTLEPVRVRSVPAIDPPAWLALVERILGGRYVDFGRVWGITLADTILVLERVSPDRRVELVFHELVHVVQYRELGVRGFAERYVAGWLAGGRRYAAIPLERDAYALQRRFRAAADPFDAEGEILRLLGVGRQYG